MGQIPASIVNDVTSDHLSQLHVQGYAWIVKQAMDDMGVSARNLAREGVISERSRKGFIEKVAGGWITTTERDAINRRLCLDPVRLSIAIDVLGEPATYFDPVTAVAASYSHQISLSLRENVAAGRWDFGSIEPRLFRAHAVKIAKELFERLRAISHQLYLPIP